MQRLHSWPVPHSLERDFVCGPHTCTLGIRACAIWLGCFGRGAASSWPARAKWTPEFIATQLGHDRLVPVSLSVEESSGRTLKTSAVAVASFLVAVWTEIHLCNSVLVTEILRAQRPRPVMPIGRLVRQHMSDDLGGMTAEHRAGCCPRESCRAGCGGGEIAARGRSDSNPNPNPMTGRGATGSRSRSGGGGGGGGAPYLKQCNLLELCPSLMDDIEATGLFWWVCRRP
jgi:hypothetical protein